MEDVNLWMRVIYEFYEDWVIKIFNDFIVYVFNFFSVELIKNIGI